MYDNDTDAKIEPRVHLTHAPMLNGNRFVNATELLLLIQDINRQATKIGWETNVLEPLEDEIREVLG